MITVVISSVLLTGALAAYRGLGAKQLVKQAGVSFQTDLKSYQQKALAGQKPEECLGSLDGYEVSGIDSNSFSVTAVCTAGAPVATDFDLPGEVIFQAAFNPGEIFFPVLTAGVDGAQTIVLQKDTYQYQVTVEASGVIRGEIL